MCLKGHPGVDRVVRIDTDETDPATATGDVVIVRVVPRGVTLHAEAPTVAAPPGHLPLEKTAATVVARRAEIGIGRTEIGRSRASVIGRGPTEIETGIVNANASVNGRDRGTETANEKGIAIGRGTEMTYGRINPVCMIDHTFLTDPPQ
jgi:3,4-dihydroxy-2-butanone 4-phosphate synthase